MREVHSNEKISFDIIGDIHGHADELEILLQKLGYLRKYGVYSHPEKRKVAFLGDFIDRGPKIRETLHLVKDMVESGNAIAIMGNHEYNAVCFHMPNTEKGGFFRNHELKEIEQHLETLRQFKNHSNEWMMFLDWFKSLPIFIEEEDFNLVHACWDNNHIEWLRENYKGLTKDFLTRASDQSNGKIEYQIVEETLKGKEVKLQNGISFKDKDGTVRQECRLKWWAPESDRNTYGDLYMFCPEELKNEKIDASIKFHKYEGDKPVFFGHYWLSGIPEIINKQAICLDYSVAKGGKLVACRLSKENENLSCEFIY